MCGICGAISLKGAAVDRAGVAAMNARLTHRGPDESGDFFDRSVGLAMRRLSIVDVEGGGQPVRSENGKTVVVYNGEIYNAPSLRDGLEKRGHVFRSRADTEVIVHLYEEHGAAAVDHMRGMFAFALWDADREILLLARDRVGKKPLYHAVTREGVLVFASELTALRSYPGLDLSLSEEDILRALALQYIPSPGTPFREAKKLPAGHVLTVRAGEVSLKRYWRLAASGAAPSYPEAVRETASRLEESVRMRLLSDVPLGALLSGGVDSSAVVAMMARATTAPVKTFSVRFDGPGGDTDSAFAREMAARYACQHHEILVGEGEALNAIPRVFDSLDEPVLDPAHLPTYLICRLARRHVKVVLTGEGGDEAFAGYARYRLAGLPPVPAGILRPAFDGLFSRGMLSTRAVKGLHALTESDEARRWALAVSPFSPVDHLRLLRREAGWTENVFRSVLDAHSSSDRLNRMLAADVETWLADDLLQKVDRMSMAVSLEARTPLLDHPFLEFVHGLPGSYKLRGRSHKRVLKAAVAGLVPRGILGRRKMGFEPPWGAWFRTRLRDNLNDSLRSRPFRSWGFIDHGEVDRLAERHQRTGRHGIEMYCLFALAEWGRRHA